MIQIQISDNFQGLLAPADRLALESAARTTLDLQDPARQADLTIRLTDDAELRRLNAQFLGIDSPTDVLSFPSGETDPETQAVYLGDIVISYPRALDQAEAGGHPFLDELRLLVVHGVLHLLGYDHAQEDEKEAMWAIQAEVLKSLNATITGPAP